MLTQRQAGEDHARGVAAMPQSTNAPSSPSTQHGAQQAGPDNDASSVRHAHPGPGVSEQESGAQDLCSLCSPSVQHGACRKCGHVSATVTSQNCTAREESRPSYCYLLALASENLVFCYTFSRHK